MSKPIHFEDYNLVHRCLCEDQSAGEELFANVYPRLHRYAQWLINRSNLTSVQADDLVNEALTRVFYKLSTYDGKATFCYFCKRYVYNVFREAIKHHNKELRDIPFDEADSGMDEGEHSLPYEDKHTLYGKNPPDVVVKAEQENLAWQALEGLPEHYQQILRLRIINNIPFKDISEMMGKSENAASLLYWRANTALKNELKKLF